MDFSSSLDMGISLIKGEWQRTLGKEITEMTTPRQALNQWISKLPKQPDGNKGDILISALRNPTWIEWGVYAACVYIQMGYKPTLLFRSSEIEKFYKGRVDRFHF